MARLLVAGTGMIGCSVALGLKAAGIVTTVCGFDRRPEHLAGAQRIGAVDTVIDDLAAARDVDLAVIAVPVTGIAPCVAALGRSPAAASLAAFDTGSVKAAVVAALERELGGVPSWFVPAHPLAGSERTGPEAANAALFRGQRVVLTPTANLEAGIRARVESAWRALGAAVSTMSAARHDALLAASSHLPHLLSFALVGQIAARDDAREVYRHSGGGLRDVTRLAASDPDMWRDVLLGNRSALRTALAEFRDALERLEALIEEDDAEALRRALEAAAAARRVYLDEVAAEETR